MAPWYQAALPDRRQMIRSLVVDVTEVVAQSTTPDEVELRQHLIDAAAQLIMASALAAAADSAKGDPGWQTALPSQKDT